MATHHYFAESSFFRRINIKDYLQRINWGKSTRGSLLQTPIVDIEIRYCNLPLKFSWGSARKIQLLPCLLPEIPKVVSSIVLSLLASKTNFLGNGG